MILFNLSFVRIILTAFYGLLLVAQVGQAADRQQVLDAMKLSTTYMMDVVSQKGGFVHRYAEDLSERWGELPARESMIWVEGSATVGVGDVLLHAYKATGDAFFLEGAKKSAAALIHGQHAAGGWHYFIDFDPQGTLQWYEEVGRKGWGFEEHNHYYGNATFDDQVTTYPARFLMDLYLATRAPEYEAAMLRALDFVLKAQYPNGGWPQRYPPAPDHFGKQFPDYTTYHTFNDGVIEGNIDFLLDVYEVLGNERYKEAAVRGMDFVRMAQLESPQAGWGLQYDMDLQSAKARTYEPAAVTPLQTVSSVYSLMKYYKFTGDRNYLGGIADALQWLEVSAYTEFKESGRGNSHAMFYELGTNKATYVHREGRGVEDGRYWIDYERSNYLLHYGMELRIDLEGIKREYQRVNALSPEKAMAEYVKQKVAQSAVPGVGKGTIEHIVGTMDDRGRWLEDLIIAEYAGDTVKGPKRRIRGISTYTYMINMRQMANYIHHLDAQE